jgi:hypothetical protein
MKANVATARSPSSQGPLVVALPAWGAIARILPSCEQASVNENMAPKLKPVEKIRFSSMHRPEPKRSSIACRKSTSSPFSFPQPRPLSPKSCPSGATRIAWPSITSSSPK